MNGRGYAYARDLWATERLWLSRSVRTLVVGLAGRLSGLGPEAWTRYERGELEFGQAREFHLALLRVHSVLAKEIDAAMSESAAAALENTAGLGDLASVTGLDRAAASRRWGSLAEVGNRIALVISQPWPDGGIVGPAGAAGYEHDRRWWPVGSASRRSAEHAIVVVDRTVRRVYAIDPEGWRADDSGTRWEFTAIGAAPLPSTRVDDAYERGRIPVRVGDHYPARLDRGCVPCYFSEVHDDR